MLLLALLIRSNPSISTGTSREFFSNYLLSICKHTRFIIICSQSGMPRTRHLTHCPQYSLALTLEPGPKHSNKARYRVLSATPGGYRIFQASPSLSMFWNHEAPATKPIAGSQILSYHLWQRSFVFGKDVGFKMARSGTRVMFFRTTKILYEGHCLQSRNGY